MDCIICGNWFSSVIHDGACPTCSRAIKQLRLNMTAGRLLELAQAEKGGRLWLLAVLPQGRPGGQGNGVYVIDDGEIYDDSVVGVNIGMASTGCLCCLYETYDGHDFYDADIGKTVFLTIEEAEAALKKEEKHEI